MGPEKKLPLAPYLAEQFVKAAVLEGAHKKRPYHAALLEGAHKKRPYLVPETAWVRQKNILGISVGASLATSERLGKIYGVTGQIIRDTNKRALTNLWLVSSDQLKERIPLASLNLRRSKFPDRLPWQKPIKVLSKTEQLANRLQHAKTDGEVQVVLNQVSRYDLMFDRQRKDRFFLPVTKLVDEYFYLPRRRIHLALDVLNDAGIPLGDVPNEVVIKRGPRERAVTHHYRLIAAQHKDRATKALVGHPSLQEFLIDPERRKNALRRKELLQLLRQVAEGGEDTGVISPIELYQHGFIAKARLRRQTVSLAHYLQTNNVRLDERLYPFLYAILSAKNPSMIIDINTIGRGRYRVYRHLTDQDKEGIAILVNELKNGKFPMRTIEQKQMYQQKLLRRKDSQGNLVVISLNDAFPLLLQRLPSMIGYFQTEYKNQSIINDDVHDGALDRIYPYLFGERGDFENFDKFLSFVFGVVKNTFREQLRKRWLERRSSEGQFGSGWQREQSLQVEKEESIDQLSNLPPEKVAILRLRLMGINIKTIAEIFGKHESNIRWIVSSNLDHINPGREKREMPTVPFNPDTALLDYQKLRELTLKAGGQLPTSYDLNKAFKQGEVNFSESRYRYHFGQGSWRKAQEELERLLATANPEPLKSQKLV